MEKGKRYPLVLFMGLSGLKIWASGASALLVSLGVAVGLIGFGIHYLNKAVACVQLLLSPSGPGALVLSVALAITLITGIGIHIFHWIKAFKNEIQEKC